MKMQMVSDTAVRKCRGDDRLREDSERITQIGLNRGDGKLYELSSSP